MQRWLPLLFLGALLTAASTAAAEGVELPRAAKITYQSKDASLRHGNLGGDVLDVDRRFALALGRQGCVRKEHVSVNQAGRKGLLSIWERPGGASPATTLYLFVIRSTRAGRTDFIIGDEAPDNPRKYHEQQ